MVNVIIHVFCSFFYGVKEDIFFKRHRFFKFVISRVTFFRVMRVLSGLMRKQDLNGAMVQKHRIKVQHKSTTTQVTEKCRPAICKWATSFTQEFYLTVISFCGSNWLNLC